MFQLEHRPGSKDQISVDNSDENVRYLLREKGGDRRLNLSGFSFAQSGSMRAVVQCRGY